MSTKSVRIAALFLAVVLCVSAGFAATWAELGPDGGDARSLSFDPRNPDHILLGTASGQLYATQNGGRSWSRIAQLGDGDDYVLDNIVFDPSDSKTVFAAVWSVERQQDAGDLFVTHDAGKTWQPIPAMQGKSIRALEIAHSNPKTLIIGALDGVFRSTDSGKTWKLISPPGHIDIRNIESIAIDPKDENIIYAGTWHLAWKTNDGGKNWHSIKKGVIDDSDVFSIIVDHSNSDVIYLSACSGIYKSEQAGELFRKIQGIPSSARRTRVLQQDPVNPEVVYAGTTEGLYKSVNSGKTFTRMTGPNIIVNDIFIDPRNPQRVLLATDRSGVLASDNAAQTFVASNRGYSHRQVASILIDRSDPETIYTGLVNDKDFGGVFVTRDAGLTWVQKSRGLMSRDVFTLQQADDGTLFAGTNRGILALDPKGDEWRPASTVVKEKKLPVPKAKKGTKAAKAVKPKVVIEKHELTARVSQLSFGPSRWFAAASNGMYSSRDNGKTWQGGAIQSDLNFISVSTAESKVLATTPRTAYLSSDNGDTWTSVPVPNYVTRIYSATITPDDALWLATPQGAFRTVDHGRDWEHVTGGLAWKQVISVVHDSEGRRLLATTRDGKGVYESSDNGRTWKYSAESHVKIRTAVGYRGGLLGATAYNGLQVTALPGRISGVAGGGGQSK